MTPAELSEKLWDNAERVAKYLLPRGHLEGKEWCAGNTNGDAGKSLKINLGGKKTWADFASGDSGDLLDLWVLVRNCQLHDAMREAKEFLGLKDDDNHFEAKKKPSHGQPKKALKRRAIATTTWLPVASPERQLINSVFRTQSSGTTMKTAKFRQWRFRIFATVSCCR
jgi:hypothetical protein